jgi:hypothetical protein
MHMVPGVLGRRDGSSIKRPHDRLQQALARAQGLDHQRMVMLGRVVEIVVDHIRRCVPVIMSCLNDITTPCMVFSLATIP